jgi:hypothetical protein
MLSKNEDVKMSGIAKSYHPAQPPCVAPMFGRVGDNQ